MWNSALKQMGSGAVEIFGPYSYLDYAKQNNMQGSAARYISIDSYELLHHQLKSNDTMVLRLGYINNTKSVYFILVKIKNKLQDYFLIDNEVFSSNKSIEFVPDGEVKRLFGFKLLPKLSETTLVNFALASGIFSKALGLDENKIPTAPATARSNFKFSFKPHSLMDESFVFNSQVEIDALFVEKRNGKDTLFVVEAKSDSSHKSLSKHKLVYPILAIYDKIPSDIPIVPVYLKIKQINNVYHFHVVECEFPDPRLGVSSIDDLKPVNHTHLTFSFDSLDI